MTKDILRKRILWGMGIVVVALLVFRIYDLGVTLTYLEQDLELSQRTLMVVETFQRANCMTVDEVPKPFSAFEKSGFVIIDGVKFACHEKVDDGDRFFLRSQ